MDPVEPKTTVDIVRDLLRFVEEGEWVEVTQYCNRGCSCNLGTEIICNTCNGEKPNHAVNCERAAIIREANAFIMVEEGLS